MIGKRVYHIVPAGTKDLYAAGDLRANTFTNKREAVRALASQRRFEREENKAFPGYGVKWELLTICS